MSNTLLLIALGLAGLVAAAAVRAAPPQVLLGTDHGDITIELATGDAPETVSNFILYVKDGFYEGTVFHRVISGFMIQGGGFTDAYSPKETRDPIGNESYNGRSNRRGTIAMARTAVPDSATSQFFINHVDNLFLDRTHAADGIGYAVFGNLLAGIEVVDRIAALPTGTLMVGGRPYLKDVPLEPLHIRSAEVLEDETTAVQKAYIAYYGRPGDPGGVTWWADYLAAVGGDLSAIIQQFGNSEEFRDRYGHLDHGALVDNIYRQLFNRDPEPAGRAFYVNLLDSGAKTLQSITLDVLYGAQNEDARIVANKLLVAGFFTDEVEERRLSYRGEHIDKARGVLAVVDDLPGSVAEAVALAGAALEGM